MRSQNNIEHNQNLMRSQSDCLFLSQESVTRNTRKWAQNGNYCHVKLSGKLDEIPKHGHRKKSMKIQFVIYADAESLLDQILACNNDEELNNNQRIL